MTRRTARALQILGVAGLFGVAATGVVIARDQRRRAEMTPDEVRERLRARHGRARNDSVNGRVATAAEAAATRPRGDPVSSG